MKGVKQGKCQNTTRKVENSDNEASTSTGNKPVKPIFSTAKNKNYDLLASLSDPGLCGLRRSSSSTEEAQAFKTRPVVSSLKRTDTTKYGVKLKNIGSTINKEATGKDLDEENYGKLSSGFDKPCEKMDYEAKSPVEKFKEESKLIVKKFTESKVEINGKRNCEFEEGSESWKKRSWKSKLKKKTDNVGDNLKKPTLIKENKTTEACTKGGSLSSIDVDVKNKSNVKSNKPSISLKPVSKLTESACFGNFLENIEKKCMKKKIGSLEEYKSKRKLSESSKEVGKEANRKSEPELVAVNIVPRKVSGILIVKNGTAPKKIVRWREDVLVKVEYFEVDLDERINVHKLKFEELRRKECEKDRRRLKEEVVKEDMINEEENVTRLVGFKALEDAGRSNFTAGLKSGEREIQRLREGRVLPSVQLGFHPVDPSEPDLNQGRDNSVVVPRTILFEDISGEGTVVDYSEEGWPEPRGSRLQYEEGFGAMQFYGETGKEHHGNILDHGVHVYSGRLGELGHRVGRGANHRGFGRGGATLQQMGGFRGGYDRGVGRRDLGGKRNIPCKYWRRGNCRDDQNCNFLHV